MSELLPVSLDVLRKQLAVEWVGDTVNVNLYALFAQLRAEIDDLNSATALDSLSFFKLDG